MNVRKYQSFDIAEDFQTGVGFSFVHVQDARDAPPLTFHGEELLRKFGSKSVVQVNELGEITIASHIVP